MFFFFLGFSFQNSPEFAFQKVVQGGKRKTKESLRYKILERSPGFIRAATFQDDSLYTSCHVLWMLLGSPLLASLAGEEGVLICCVYIYIYILFKKRLWVNHIPQTSWEACDIDRQPWDLEKLIIISVRDGNSPCLARDARKYTLRHRKTVKEHSADRNIRMSAIHDFQRASRK